MGIFDFLGKKPSEQNKEEDGQDKKGYSCMSCGNKLTGLCWYCEGCSGYLCRTCGVAMEAGGTRARCPNCGTELSNFTF